MKATQETRSLLFDWKTRQRRPLRVVFYLIVAIFFHAVFFYLFRVGELNTQPSSPRQEKAVLISSLSSLPSDFQRQLDQRMGKRLPSWLEFQQPDTAHAIIGSPIPHKLQLAEITVSTPPVSPPTLFPDGGSLYPAPRLNHVINPQTNHSDESPQLRWVFEPVGVGPSGTSLPPPSDVNDYAEKELLAFSLTWDRTGRIMTILPLRRGDPMIFQRLSGALQQLPFPKADASEATIRSGKAYAMPMTEDAALALLFRQALFLLAREFIPAFTSVMNDNEALQQAPRTIAPGQYLWCGLIFHVDAKTFEMPWSGVPLPAMKYGSFIKQNDLTWRASWP